MPKRAAAEIRHFSTRIDLSAEARGELVETLNQSLADALDLYSQVKQAHWNVKGPQFIALHELFDATAGEVLGYVDELAERATTLGGVARGTVRMAAEHSTLSEYPSDVIGGLEHVAALCDRLAAFTAHCRRAIDASAELGDQATADLYTEITRGLDKRLWFLEAHLQDHG